MPESPTLTVDSNDDPLSILAVFDRLEVGPVKLERKRLVAPYRLFYGDQAEQTELIYTYEEDVFDPGRPESRNLADMIAAQVALNYGLFCREIVFNGLFDKTDRQFIKEMAENTAREIFVKKFLEPNPFLVGEAARLTAVKPKAFLRAQLTFPVTVRTDHRPPWNTDSSRHCVLSSGGKDSLLSFGLLDETGREVHPIFVNESGRHWYTALNAYRHFRDNIPNTARVWVNADRLYPWMLRRMPFIRKDFAGVRSDEYPIRLWTVAVFLFGVLPLLRKRGIGRLIIGDEFDTSRRVTTQGIRHYDGLYDQSIWFDTALSRYFMRKGWGVSQFSMLRSLSELLIEKLLVKRYAHIQEHQTSCHATHKAGDRIKPCGKCEKCRRIVGMLTALAEDPSRCGYSDNQVAACLTTLFDKGVYSQASAEAGQLFFMLAQLDHLRVPDSVARSVKPYPEIMKLRFDPTVSPIDGIPQDLRVTSTASTCSMPRGRCSVRGNPGCRWIPLSTRICRPPMRPNQEPCRPRMPVTATSGRIPIFGGSSAGRMPPIASTSWTPPCCRWGPSNSTAPICLWTRTPLTPSIWPSASPTVAVTPSPWCCR